MAHKCLKGRKQPRGGKYSSAGYQAAQERKRKKMRAKGQREKKARKLKEREAKIKKLEEYVAQEEAELAKKVEETQASKEEAERRKAEEEKKAAEEKVLRAEKRKAEALKAEEDARPATSDGLTKLKTKKQLREDRKKHRQQAVQEQAHKSLYSGGKVLLVGEGNFSFACALAKHLGKEGEVFATTLDSEQLLKRKYPDAAKNRKELEDELNGTSLVGLDATQMHKVRELRKAFTTVVWNFPHLGGDDDDTEEKSIEEHQKLLGDFFKSALKCLEEEASSTIHVALRSCEPEKSWKIKQTVTAACPEVDLIQVVPFAPSAWEGYEFRRTNGVTPASVEKDAEIFAEKGAKVFVFGAGSAGAASKRKKRKKDKLLPM